MAIGEPSALLRAGLLDGVAIVLAGAGEPGRRGPGFAGEVRSVCTGLGARVAELAAVTEGDAQEREAAVDAALAEALAELGGVGVAIVDGAGLFERADPPEALAETLEACWDVTRALANRAFVGDSAGGRILLLAPRSEPGAGNAAAAAAGLENLARTLSIEWARYGITVLAIAPGLETMANEVGALCAWLASPAGAYFSGCLLDLRGVPAAG
jgi:NAD(P)-dependent dehydrogenase (short-subunit alcohol dehydrogenase family)